MTERAMKIWEAADTGTIHAIKDDGSHWVLTLEARVHHPGAAHAGSSIGPFMGWQKVEPSPSASHGGAAKP